MARDYKAAEARRRVKFVEFKAWLPRDLGEKCKIKLKKENKRIVDFIREAVEEYLKKGE